MTPSQRSTPSSPNSPADGASGAATVSAPDYGRAVATLERALAFGIHPSLDGITELCEALGRPQDRFACIQVTGTNGKTSTVRMLAAVLAAHGLRTGLYTSPHLERYPERIEINGSPVSDEAFGARVGEVLAAAESVRGATATGSQEGFTEFELLTATALHAFARAGVDVAVLEVGMGGRWDATSVVVPRVSVITGVGLDHTAVLGQTLAEIAAEKAAIIREGSIAVTGPGCAPVFDVIAARARGCHAELRTVAEAGTPGSEGALVVFSVRGRPVGPMGSTSLDVTGAEARYPALEIAPAYQAANVATAIAAAEAFLGGALDVAATRKALTGLTLAGRFEVVSEEPLVVVDGSHNPQAAAVLADAVVDAWPDPTRRPTVLLGVLADKDAAGIVEALAPVAGRFVVTSPDSPRALGASGLASVVEATTGVRPPVYASIPVALTALVGACPHGLLVTGSLTTAGQARTSLRHRAVTDAVEAE